MEFAANTDDGGFARIITAAGVDKFMEKALKLEVGAAAISKIETTASKTFRKQALAASPARKHHHRQRSIESDAGFASVSGDDMQHTAGRQARRRRGGGALCSAKPIHD